MAWSYSGETGLKVFTYLVYLSVVTVAIPYFISACAQLAYLVSRRRRKVQGWALARDLAVAIGRRACSRCGSPSPRATSPCTRRCCSLLIGIPLYAFLKAQRERGARSRLRSSSVTPASPSISPHLRRSLIRTKMDVRCAPPP